MEAFQSAAALPFAQPVGIGLSWRAMKCWFWVGMAGALVCGRDIRAAVINVTPTDSYTKIEAAQAGDEVIIAPGTYTFRVHLTAKAPASNPINIHALDP